MAGHLKSTVFIQLRHGGFYDINQPKPSKLSGLLNRVTTLVCSQKHLIKMSSHKLIILLKKKKN